MEYTQINELDRELVRHAVEASDRLYVKGIQEVGAAARTRTGQIFSGIHFETGGSFATVCGEITAICCMVSAGHRDLETIVAVWRDPGGKHFPLPPCGRCREVISDFNPNAWVVITTLQSHWETSAIEQLAKVRIADLLPLKANGLVTSTM